MSPAQQTVAALHRYPVKSMMGESLNSTEVGTRGLLHDRSFALGDPSNGKVVSAKNPGKWPTLFAFRAALARGSGSNAVVEITLPDGQIIASNDPVLETVLSRALGRPVTFLNHAPAEAKLEEYWPDMEELSNRDIVTEEPLPQGTFFDCATVHLLTTATLDTLRSLYPAGRFEPRRFRPNVIIATPPEITGFAESAWIGKAVSLGSQVQLKITGPCPRCVMTTLAQDDLPRDPLVLKTAAKHNHAHVGVYASVTKGGVIRRGDVVHVD
ncbi:MAG: domain containing protein [Phycisphaerales bacterium]|jgi:uncharacterized protein YcbX|nr:domain containing protein [Phycisphaerales bacterium]MDB5356725.1 domain containing protein [Phycisphaerales bacterium]